MLTDSKDFILRIIILAIIHTFVKMNKGCLNFVESADWARTTVDLKLPWEQITFVAF